MFPLACVVYDHRSLINHLHLLYARSATRHFNGNMLGVARRFDALMIVWIARDERR